MVRYRPPAHQYSYLRKAPVKTSQGLAGRKSGCPFVFSEKIKKIVVPGEMENIILTDKMLALANEEICVEVKENE